MLPYGRRIYRPNQYKLRIINNNSKPKMGKVIRIIAITVTERIPIHNSPMSNRIKLILQSPIAAIITRIQAIVLL